MLWSQAAKGFAAKLVSVGVTDLKSLVTVFEVAIRRGKLVQVRVDCTFCLPTACLSGRVCFVFLRQYVCAFGAVYSPCCYVLVTMWTFVLFRLTRRSVR